MVISIEFLSVALGLLITIATFVFTRFKEAENRGRFLQRIDQLEQTFNELRERTRSMESGFACHDTDLVKYSSELEGLKTAIDKIDKKIDKLIDKWEEDR